MQDLSTTDERDNRRVRYYRYQEANTGIGRDSSNSLTGFKEAETAYYWQGRAEKRKLKKDNIGNN
jgi:hypothetical protein